MRRRKREAAQPLGYVNEYDLDVEALKKMNCFCVAAPNEEWLDFVMKNRTDLHFKHDFDVVYGSVANDRVYAAFALYEGGLLSMQNLIAELKTYKLVDQYLIHTQRALQAIRYVTAKQIQL